MSLDSKDRDRLEKLLNMLGSPVDGEIANAGRMIQKMAERYNVTPGTLCLGNPPSQSRPEPERAQSRGERGQRSGPWGTGGFEESFGYAFRRAAEQAAKDAEKAAEKRRQQAYHEAREAELRKAAAERAAQAKAKRRPRLFPGNYFGLLARLKMIYDEQFDSLDSWKIDFIEIALESCKADRMMTRRQTDMARAIIKYNENAEPLV